MTTIIILYHRWSLLRTNRNGLEPIRASAYHSHPEWLAIGEPARSFTEPGSPVTYGIRISGSYQAKDDLYDICSFGY